MSSLTATDVIRDRFEARWMDRPEATLARRNASRPCPIVTLIPQLIQIVASRPTASHDQMQAAFAQLVYETAFAEESGDLVADEDFKHELEAQTHVMVDVIKDAHEELQHQGRWPEPVGSDAYVG